MKIQKDIIRKYCLEICKKEDLGKPKISLRSCLKAWGLCYNKLEEKNIIRLNKCLIDLDLKLIKKYCGVELWNVLIHEIAHLKKFNHFDEHNKDFWEYYKHLLKKYSKLKSKFYNELREVEK
jgi:predicted metal-dependent hydrolase